MSLSSCLYEHAPKRVQDWMRIVVGVLVLISCAKPDPGISRERAEHILHGFGLRVIELSPTSDGWDGTADFGPDTYRLRAKVNRNGIVDLSPDERAITPP